MGVHKICEGVYSVGVQNPNLRVFDIIMRTDYGTTYNAYLVRGAKKMALIETVHAKFFDEYLENITQIVDVSEIDYVVLNHTEPDHSGSLKRLLELNPEITVVASTAGKRFLSEICNCGFNCLIAGDEKSLDLGGKSLIFKAAPFLHWPDSIFSYLPEDKVLFSCDFLGCHYCEPQLFDDKIRFKNYYDEAFDYYFHAIFGPFKDYVRKGLEIVRELDVCALCPSHGPVLVSGIREALERYEKLAAPLGRSGKRVLVVYASAYGCTGRLAEEIAGRIRAAGEVEVIDVLNVDLAVIKEKIDDCDGFLIGSPTINRDAVKPIWDVLACVDAVSNRGKLCGAFGSYGWSGEAVGMLESRMKLLKLGALEGGMRANFVPSESEVLAAREFGDRFAEVLNS